MAPSLSPKIKPSIALMALTAILTSCGGSSENTTGSALSSTSENTRSQSGATLRLTAAPPKTAPSDAASSQFLAVSSSQDPTSSSTSDGPFGQDPSKYTLTFQDNFDGNLDRGIWNTGRNETADATTNYATSNGTLKIWPERGKNGEFFKRTLDTDGHFSQRYGYFEVEAKSAKGNGVWPAFWLFNQIGDRRPEIDILEAYPGGIAPWGDAGRDGVPVAKMYAPVVWTNGGERAGYEKVATPDLSAAFHRYGLKWEPDRTTFYFDGREVYTLDVKLSDPLYIMLTLWFGSASGEPDNTTPVGQSNAFEINYVKVWQFK